MEKILINIKNYFNIILFKIYAQRKPFLITIFSALIAGFMLLNYVGNSLFGRFEWLILPSDKFGIPTEIAEKTGLTTLYKDYIHPGWDGQFYYYISNDLLGVKDTKDHIDVPGYRYQRIGFPLLAKAVSIILGKRVVSVSLYIYLYLFILMIAAYFFAGYLKKRNHSVFWILPWLFSVGVQITFRHGLVDGAADAILLLSILLILERKYIFYSIMMTFACLTKESNVSIAFMIFIMGFLGFLEEEKKWKISFAFLLAIPGIVFISWYAYISLHFGAIEKDDTLIGLFLVGFFKCLVIAIKQKNQLELLGLCLYFIILFLAFILEFGAGRKNKIFYSLLLITFLNASFGSMVMCHYSGYLKNTSSLLMFIPIMLFYDNQGCVFKNKIICFLISFFMAIVFFTGLIFINNFHKDVFFARFFPINETVDPDAIPLSDFSGNIHFLEINRDSKLITMPLANIFMNNNYLIIDVNISNNSKQLWHWQRTAAGTNGIRASYHWFEENNLDKPIIDGIRTPLLTDLAGGNSIDLEMLIKMPSRPGSYLLRLSLVQEGVAWFYHMGSGFEDWFVTILPNGKVFFVEKRK